MSGSGTGEILGAATAIGGWATLPYTAGNNVAYFLNILLIGSGVMVVTSLILSRIVASRLKD